MTWDIMIDTKICDAELNTMKDHLLSNVIYSLSGWASDRRLPTALNTIL